MRVLLLLVAPLLAVGLSAQRTLFVDANNGSDLNSGLSRSQPFKSITFASLQAADDDTIVVLPGTYSPSLTGEVLPIEFGTTGTSSTQNRIRIYGEGGPAVTIFDAEMGSTSVAVPMMRFRYDADGASLSGFTFTNTGSADYWSMCIRLGSTSGGGFAARNVEIYGNVFRDVNRAIVVFGTDPSMTVPNQTTGCSIHDNLIVNTTERALAVWGDGNNAAYNNTVVASSHDGIWVDNLFGVPSPAVIANNIVVGGTGNGISAGPLGTAATFANNNSFGNAVDYAGATYGPSNTSVDPMFVNAMAGDYHLQAGSPMIEAGSLAVPILRTDLDRMSRAHDSNNNGFAGVDKGCYQFHLYNMMLGGGWAPGQKGQIVFSGAPTVGLVFISFDDTALLLQPFGVLVVDPTALVPVVLMGPCPGTTLLPLPNNPSLLGTRLVLQGGTLGPLYLINADWRTL